MDLDIIQSTKEGEITQFLCDVRDYFKASLATSEYENTSNMFYLTAADTTEQLLKRCECLLSRLKSKNQNIPLKTHKSQSNIFSPFQQTAVLTKNHQWQRIGDKSNNNDDEKNPGSVGDQLIKREMNDNEDVSYLDMSAPHYNNNTKETSARNIVDLNKSEENDKTFRCSTLVVTQNKSFLHRLHDTTTTTIEDEPGAKNKNENAEEKNENYEDDAQIYDICQVTTQGSDGEEDELVLEETQKVITQNSHFSLPNIDCPYLDLPAGHLAIKKSIKYGQLIKIEKRLFFDQSKKCYCGILDDWLLCYADGPTSNRPTISLYLKIPGIEIEHFGEGKRRDVCFQITTCDPNKRFVFQAVNEIDAKEWIHAVEAAIRSDTTGIELKNSPTRKLPTPPPMKKVTFLNSFKAGTEAPTNTTSSNDCIYEEPSPIHNVKTKFSPEKRPELPHKQNNPFLLARKFEYDVPKCPPQPLQDDSGNSELLINPYESNETNSPVKTHTITLSESVYLASSPASAQDLNPKMEENLDFQAKVKDVHSKLTSQLSNGPNIKKSLKKSLSSAPNDTESLSLPSPTSSSTLTESLELKKQKKTSNPSNSPQKTPNEKSSFAKNWFLNRLNKNTSSTRSNSSSSASSISPSKCKQSEKENLLNSSADVCDGYEVQLSSLSSNPGFPISLKPSSPNRGTSKVNMIINQLEASGHFTASMFNTDAVASFSSFCDNDFSNYEPIMTVSTPPANLMKNV